MAQKFIQVGITALRDPATGGFLPAVPLYIEATEETMEAEAIMIKDLGKVFAQKMKQYIDGGGLIGKADKCTDQAGESTKRRQKSKTG